MLKQADDEEKLDSILKIIVVIATILAIIVVSFYFIKFSGPLSEGRTDWAVFSDYTGEALNPVFVFLALISLLVALSFEAKELKLTRKELKNSSDALNAQNKALLLRGF